MLKNALSLVLTAIIVAPLWGQMHFFPGKDSTGTYFWGERNRGGAGVILGQSDSLYDLGILLKNGKFNWPSWYYGMFIGRFNTEGKLVGSPLEAFYELDPYVHYPLIQYSSSLYKLDSNRYFQTTTTALSATAAIYNLSTSNRQTFRLDGGGILNQNWEYHPPYFYFLIGKSQYRIRDSTGTIISNNEHFITSDSLALVRFHTEKQVFDTVGLYRQPLQGQKQKINRARGYLQVQPDSGIFRYVKLTDTVLQYQMDQFEPLHVQRFFQDDPIWSPYYALTVNPRDTLLFIGGYKTGVYPDYKFAPDTLLLEKVYLSRTSPPKIIIDSVFLKAPGCLFCGHNKHHFDREGNLYIVTTSRSSLNPENSTSLRLYKYSPNLKKLLWQQELYPDSTYHGLGDVMVNERNELVVFSTIAGYPNNYAYTNRPLLTHFKKSAPSGAAHLEVFPNPTRDALFLQSSQNWPQGFIIDLSGKRVYRFSHKAGETSHLDLQWLNPGLYLLHLRNNSGKQVVRKILKN